MTTLIFPRPWDGVPDLPPEPSAVAPTYTIEAIPTIEIIEAFESDLVRVARWVDIYEADNVTLWRQKVALTEGSVSVDMSRSERRNFQCTLYDDGTLGYGPGNFWYDKVLKPYRGVVFPNDDVWATPLGEFMPDNIERPHFPNLISCACRDFVKKLRMDKFPDTTTFAAGLNVGNVIQTIAVNGGVTKFNFATTTATLLADTTFERETERWQAIEELAQSIGFEVFFSSFGYLTFRPNVDPLLAPLSYTFRTGVGEVNLGSAPEIHLGNLVSFTKATTDTLMFNDVIVFGSSQTNALVWARATNTNINSPTRVAEIGRRMKFIPSSFVPNNTAAQEVADSFLAVSALEQFDMNVSSIVVPWLEAGDAVEVLDPDAAPGDPTRYLLSNFTIPMALEAMSGNAKRVTIVG
jgi:hypothetical protein